MRAILRLSSLVFVALLARGASAQSDATAEILFRDGKKLLAQKKYDQACPKFAESARIAASSGVELALGLCYEAQGKTASAWGAFTATVALARRDARRDRERVAVQHASQLEPKVSRVTFVVDKATAALEGVELREDGAPLGGAAWADVPVDPGEHHVEVVAPGHVPFSSTFTVSDDASEQSVPIPALVPVPPPAPVAPPPPPVVVVTTPWRTVGLAMGGVGVASLAVGAILGAVALGKVNDAEKACPSSPCGNAGAVSEDQSGGTFADASTGMFVAGGVLVGAGVAAYFLAPKDTKRATSSSTTGRRWGAPVLGAGYAGWAGTF